MAGVFIPNYSHGDFIIEWKVLPVALCICGVTNLFLNRTDNVQHATGNHSVMDQCNTQKKSSARVAKSPVPCSDKYKVKSGACQMCCILTIKLVVECFSFSLYIED